MGERGQRIEEVHAMRPTISRLMVTLGLALSIGLMLPAVAAADVTDEPSVEWKVNWALVCGGPCGGYGRTVHATYYADGTGIVERTNLGMPSASHEHWTIASWYIGANGHFWIADATIFIPDTKDAFPLSDVQPVPLDTGIIATDGHYLADYVWGEQAPAGAAFTLEVIGR
jgi:hypothetical protein